MITLLVALLAASPVETQVAEVLAGADSFSPAQFTRAMKALAAIGPAAVPALGKQLDAQQGDNALWTICEALNRMPGDAALPALERRLTHRSSLVRSGCIQAYGACLAQGGRTVERMKRLRSLIESGDCGERVSAAWGIGPLDDAELRVLFDRLITQPGCDRKVAIFGLRSAKTNTDAIGARLLAILQDTHEDVFIREAAAGALVEQPYAPARPYLRTLLTGEDPGMNIRAFAIEALGKVGTRDDLELLRHVIASDPFKGIGVWAINAREAIARIEGKRH